MAIFTEFIIMLEHAGVSDVILPFALVFTVVFAILNKTKILGTHPDKEGKPTKKPKTNLNSMVALVMGFTVIFAHFFGMYPVNRDPVIIINSSLASVSVILVAVVMVLILVGAMFGGKTLSVDGGFKISGIIKWLAVAIILYVFAVNMGFATFGRFHISRTTQVAVVALLIFGLIVWMVTKKDKPKHAKGEGPWDKDYKPLLLLNERGKEK